MKPKTTPTKSVEIVIQNQVAFDLKDGTRLLLHKEDYETLIAKIRIDVMVQMMLDCPDRVFFGSKPHNEEKIKSLYAILKEQSETMSADMKENYLKAILELSKSDDVDAISMKQKQDEQNSVGKNV